MSRWSALVLGVCTFAVTVTPALGQPLPAESPRSATWRQIVTPDLIVAGNVTSGELQRILGELTGFRDTLATLFPKSTFSGAVPTWVVVFRDSQAFARFQPRDSRGKPLGNVGGYFSRRADANFIVLPAFRDDSGLQSLFHEYTHYIVSRNVRTPVPAWLSEGLAEFYSTYRGDYRGRTMIGAIPPYRMQILKNSTFVPLRDIVSPRDLESSRRLDTRMGMFYAESWALVHYIAVARKNPIPNPLGKYIGSFARLGNHDAAFKEAFGTDVEGMDRELREYVQRVGLQVMMFDMRAETKAHDEATPMSEADANALEGRLLVELGVDEEAERELMSVLKPQPAHGAAQIALARLRLSQDREDEAISMLQDVVAATPSHGAAQYYLGTALERAWRHEEALAAFQKAIDLMPRNPSPWSGVNAAALGLRRDAQASAAVQNAMQVEWSPSFYWTQALHALRLGRDEVAASSLLTYMKLRGTGEDQSVYPLFVCALAARRAGRPADAEAALAIAEKGVTGEEWTLSILRFLQGSLDEGQLLRAAGNVGRQTEARTYIGLTRATEGREEEALAHFRWVAERGAKTSMEYELVKNELNRLKYRNKTEPRISRP